MQTTKHCPCKYHAHLLSMTSRRARTTWAWSDTKMVLYEFSKWYDRITMAER
jgi:hypothetical protein